VTALAGRQWDEATSSGVRQDLDEVDRQLRLDEFGWPCDRRDAHGPHKIDRYDAVDEVAWVFDCPGVAAHPATMIGRAS